MMLVSRYCRMNNAMNFHKSLLWRRNLGKLEVYSETVYSTVVKEEKSSIEKKKKNKKTVTISTIEVTDGSAVSKINFAKKLTKSGWKNLPARDVSSHTNDYIFETEDKRLDHFTEYISNLNEMKEISEAEENEDNEIAEISTDLPEECNGEDISASKKSNGNRRLKVSKSVSRHTDILNAYIPTCIPKYLDSARFVLFESHSKNLVGHVKPFNYLLYGGYLTGDLKIFQGVYDVLKNSDVSPNLNTFAHMLAGLGKINTPESRSLTEEVVKWMNDLNVNIGYMIRNAIFPKNDKESAIFAFKQAVDASSLTTIYNNKSEKRILFANSHNNSLTESMNSAMLNSETLTPFEGVVEYSDLVKGYYKQLETERRGYIDVSLVWKTSQTDLVADKKHKDLMGKWRKALEAAFRKQKNFLHKSHVNNNYESFSLHPYLAVLDESEYINAMMLEVERIMFFSEAFSPSYHNLVERLGAEILRRYLIKYYDDSGKTDAMNASYEDYLQWYSCSKSQGGGYNNRAKYMQMMNQNTCESFLKSKDPMWTKETKKMVGNILYTMIIGNTYIGEDKLEPAFLKTVKKRDSYSVTEIVPSEKLLKLVKEKSKKQMKFPSDLIPMECPPLPWFNFNHGGYLFSRNSFLRPAGVFDGVQENMIKQTKLGNIYPTYDGINVLSSLPWKVNTEMLDLVIDIFNKDGWEDMCIPSHSSFSKEIKKPKHVMCKEELRDYLRKVENSRKHAKESYALWCECHLKLSLTNEFRDKIFWLPQNMDFRGRCYPVPPNLTHVSSDLYRSLLLFAKGKKLGEDGLKWLKIHVINLTALKKKSSLADRLQFCEENLENIFNSADDPLNCKWWSQGDDPWQTLAACKELTKALRSDSPPDFVSHIPVHQDGSCNGLQHYAALGRDKMGAISVNLINNETPRDVYSDVLDIVKEKLKKEDRPRYDDLAKLLLSEIGRKTIKQTIMTTVYGVTQYGARRQIEKQLKENKKFENNLEICSAYLCGVTLESLAEMFQSTKKIQDWFGDWSDYITRTHNKNVKWITPLGLPISQPYNNKKIKRVACSRKNKNAFPPNFIHSLDSCHMLLTAQYCQMNGISFASIHDCFWTHACDIDVMSKICREQFVALYSLPILENLDSYFKSNFPIVEKDRNGSQIDEAKLKKIENPPDRGELDINEVLNSTFFFS